jgi:hypothetical protein
MERKMFYEDIIIYEPHSITTIMLRLHLPRNFVGRTLQRIVLY